MKKLIVLLLLAFVGVRGWQHYQEAKAVDAAALASTNSALPLVAPGDDRVAANDLPVRATQAVFQCEDKHYCSEMRSCEEAKFYLNNCPNPKMDGNHDGVPCEQQWCH